MSTQKRDIFDYLNRNGSITRMEAFSQLGICELSSRIGELEKNGYVFHRERKSDKARNGRKWTVTQYSLLSCKHLDLGKGLKLAERPVFDNHLRV